MAAAQTSLLNSRYLNDNRLYALIVIPMCLAVFAAMARLDLTSSPDVSSLVTFSVRLAVPWLFIAFAASALATLIRSPFTRWVIRNRRIFGLCYATGMGWQLFFIIWLLTGHFDYYLAKSYSATALAEQVPGYLLLMAMTLTSFKPGRKLISARQWRILHLFGIYWLWAVTWSTYWYELFYYDDRQVIDYVYYWAGIGAWGLRMMAWIRKRAPKLATQPSA